MIAYKLTKKNREAHGGFIWPENQWVETSGNGNLCGPGWLHFYSDPLLAVLMNPIHANIPADDMILWEAEVEGKIRDEKVKLGATRARLVKQVELPILSIVERVCIAINLAKAANKPGFCPAWEKWAEDYLSNKDRSANAAYAAYAAYYADNAAHYAAYYAANAAYYADNAAHYAANAAYAAYYADNAAHAANYAAYANIDIITIIHQAVKAERERAALEKGDE